MHLGKVLRELWEARVGLLASLLVATLAAIWSVQKVSLWPPDLEPRSYEIAAAATRVLVDTPKSSVLDLSVQTTDLRGITNRALLVSNVMASAPVREYIARDARIDSRLLQVASPVTPDFPRQLAQSGQQGRVSSILRSPQEEYRLSLRANPTVPIVDVYAQAPTGPEAEALADAAVSGMQEYLDVLAVQEAIPVAERVSLEQLGAAKGDVINRGVGVQVAALTFLVVFAASCAATLVLIRVRRGWRMAGQAAA